MADNQSSSEPKRSIDKGDVQVPVVAIDIGGTGAEILWEGSGGGGGGGTEYTEDAAAAANPTGTVPILVRSDTPAPQTTADGDNVAQRGTDYGAAYVTLLDVSGSPVAVAGGTQYTEDAPAAANPTGNMMMAVRADALAGVTSADGDNIALRATDNGELYVSVDGTIPVSDAGGSLTVDDGGASLTVDGTVAVTDGGGSITVDGTVTITDGAGAITVDNGGTFAVQADTELTTADLDTGGGTDTRAVVGLVGSASGGGALIPGSATDGLLVNLGANNDVVISDGGNTITVDGTVTVTDGAGPLSVDDNGGSLTVDGTVAVSSVGGTVAVTQSGAWDEVGINDSGNSITVDAAELTTLAGAVRAEDAATGDGHTGIPALARRTASPANTSGADLDYEMLQVNGGRLWVDPSGVTLTVASHAVTNAGTFAVQATAVGNVAEGTAVSGAPVLVGGRAESTTPAAQDDGDVVHSWMTVEGAVVTQITSSLVKVTVTPTIATSGYVDNDQIGGEMNFGGGRSSGRGGFVVGATLTSRTIVANALQLWLFEADPTPAGSDSAALDFTDANFEAARPFAVIDFAATDYSSTASGSFVFGSIDQNKVAEPFVLSGSANIFGYLQANGTPAGQYGGTTDIVVNLYVQQN